MLELLTGGPGVAQGHGQHLRADLVKQVLLAEIDAGVNEHTDTIEPHFSIGKGITQQAGQTRVMSPMLALTSWETWAMVTLAGRRLSSQAAIRPGSVTCNR